MKDKIPLVVILGPTASGKTALSIEMAKIYNGEIICADSRTVYKGMDIGTAKPSREEINSVPHWGLDLVEPGEYFSVADFKEYAIKKIDEIKDRGHVPFLVGGSGLYIDSVIFDYKFGSKVDIDIRDKFEKFSLSELYEYCNINNISLPENIKNKRYIVRSIENFGCDTSRRTKPIDDVIIVGISVEKNLLRSRIEIRAEQLFDNGSVEEARLLGEKYGWDSEALKGNIYPLAHLYLDGKISWEDMKSKYVILDWHLAKRQMTWFKRNGYINWFTSEDARIFLFDKLAKLTSS